MTQVKLSDYKEPIQLTKAASTPAPYWGKKEMVVDELLQVLIKDTREINAMIIPRIYEDKRNLLRGLLNTREPNSLDNQFIQQLDSLLQAELKEKGIVEIAEFKTVKNTIPDNPFSHSDKYVLWQGDITRLKVDAIVNAANKHMLGCFHPLHACIDNAIHSAAGPQLRDDCQIIMSMQQESEKTGGAKITRGYNLPAKFVLHTVGPIVSKGTEVTNHQKENLASSYVACLDLANEIEEIKMVAFCAISTGVFGFPKQEAAHIAIRTVDEWLTTHSHRFEKIIFNVFSSDDYEMYLKNFESDY